MSVPLLLIEDLCIDQTHGGRRAYAAARVSTSLRRGECVAFLGERWAGKSALAAAVAGVAGRASRSGRIVFEGRDLRTLSEREMRGLHGRHIVFLASDLEDALDPRRCLAEHFTEVLGAHRELSEAQVARRARAALTHCAIDPDRLGAYPLELAPPERARAAVALALLHGPDLLVADEPADKLDPSVQRELIGILRGHCRARGAALLWMTRDVAGVELYADRVAIMHAGEIVEEGPARATLQRPSHPYTRGLVDALPSRFAAGARLRPLPVAPGAPRIATACAFRDRCGWAMHACLAAPGLQPIGPLGEGRTVRCHRPSPVGAPLA